MSVADLKDRLIALPGGGEDKVRLARVSQGLQDKKISGVVDLYRLANGKLFVNDGRHRLIAAHALGIPVKVRISEAKGGKAHGTVPLIK